MGQSLHNHSLSVYRLFLAFLFFADITMYAQANPAWKPQQITNPKRKAVMAPSSFSNVPINQISLSRGGESGMSVQDKAIVGAGALFIMDTVVRKAFRANKISFPAQLGGCILLFVTMVLSEAIFPGMGDCIFHALTPGAALLTKWLPVFFVPGLAMLPLAPSIGTTRDVSSFHSTFLSITILEDLTLTIFLHTLAYLSIVSCSAWFLFFLQYSCIYGAITTSGNI
jgi:hypothetical protein